MNVETSLIDERLSEGLYWVFDLPDWLLFMTVTIAAMLVTLVSWRIIEIMFTKPGLHQSSISARRLRLGIGAGGAVIGAILALLLAQSWREFVVSTIVAEPPSAAGQAGHGNSPLGMNLAPVVDWSDEDPFIDYFKLSREWIPLCVPGVDAGCSTWWDTGEKDKIQVDAHGWVKSLPNGEVGTLFTRVTTLLMTDASQKNYAGNYVVLYDGEGEIIYANGGTKISGAPGRDVISVAANGNLQLTITRTDPQGVGNYIRNIRVVRQENETLLGSSPFNPVWLSKLEPFRTLRLMDWMRTNGSQEKDFSARSTEADARYTTDKGVPLEVMVKLANQANSEPWFNMPHKASDDYVTQFASYVKDHLDGSLKVYVEYSNEVWNGIFSQGSDIESWAQAEIPGGSDSGFTKRINWFGKRSAQVCQIWKNAFGDQSNRVICVLGAQAANSWTATQALDCPLYQSVFGGKTCQDMGLTTVAIAPYFGGYLGLPAFQDQVGLMSVDDLFTEITAGDRGRLMDTNPSDWDSLPEGGALAEAYRWMDDYDAMAGSRDLHVVAYEGGQHLAGVGNVVNDPTIDALFQAVNRDPRMGAVYTEYLNHWKATPNRRLELFVPFLLAQRYSKFGSWGTLEFIDQSGSPKYDALTSFAGANACWWLDCELGGSSAILPQSLTVAVTGAGTVTSSPAGISCGTDCTETLAAGSSVTLTANASMNTNFTGWGGACAGTALTCTLTMDAAKTVSASFAAPLYPVTVSNAKPSMGVVTSDVGGINCGTACMGSVESGAVIMLTAKPLNGGAFTGWSGACAGTALTCALTMDAAKTVTANFAPIYTLTVTNANPTLGMVISDVGGINCGANCVTKVIEGATIKLTAKPNNRRRFYRWSGACSGSSTTCTISNFNGNKSVSAQFR